MKESGVYRLSTGGIGDDLTGSNHFIKQIDNVGNEIILCLDNGSVQGPMIEQAPEIRKLSQEILKKSTYMCLTHGHGDHFGEILESYVTESLCKDYTILCSEITKKELTFLLPIFAGLEVKFNHKAMDLSKRIGQDTMHVIKLENIYNDMKEKNYSGIDDYLYYGKENVVVKSNINKGRRSLQEQLEGKNSGAVAYDFIKTFNYLKSLGIKDIPTLKTVLDKKISEINIRKHKLSNIKVLDRMKLKKKEFKDILSKFKSLDFNTSFVVSEKPWTRVTLIPSNHMLGAAMIQIETEFGIMLYSGDIPRLQGNRFLPGPELHFDQRIDYLLMESTYGDRLHQNSYEQGVAEIQNAVGQHKKGSTTIFPTIASRGAEMACIIIEKLIDLAKKNILHEKLIILGLSNKEFMELAEVCGGPGYELLRKYKHMYECMQYVKGLMPSGIYMANAGMLEGISLELAKDIAQDKNAQIYFSSYIVDTMPGHRLINTKTIEEDDGISEIEFKGTVTQISGTSGHGDQQDLLDFRYQLGMPFTELVHGDPSAKIELQKQMYAQPGNKNAIEIATGFEWKKVM